jgi:6-phosphogluconolactonase (cycloisomerase 2 family)
VVSSFPDKDLRAEIRLSPNDRFVYVRDRGVNTMTMVLRNPRTGTLSIVQHVIAGGKLPVIRGQVRAGILRRKV